MLAALAVQVLVLVALIKGLAAAGLIADPLRVTAAFNVPLAPPSPEPSPSREPKQSVAGGAAAGRQGTAAPRAQEVAAAAAPPVVLSHPLAPSMAASGNAGTGSGAGESGAGSGSGGSGTGTGTGTGTGGARKVEKIAGDIRSTRDYPAAGRGDRLGRRVVIAVTVGIDGRPTQCRVARPSGNDEADRITCRLAMERFRFRPAADGNGTPTEAVYGWEQRWFVP